MNNIKLLGEGYRGKVYLMKTKTDEFAVKPLNLIEYNAVDANKKMPITVRTKKYIEWREIEIAKFFMERDVPFIVKIYKIIKHSPGAWIIMEYLRDGTLKEHLNKFTQDDFDLFLHQLTGGLRWSLKHGYIHGDLHLENILYSGKQWKWIDFSRSQIKEIYTDKYYSSKLKFQYDAKTIFGKILEYAVEKNNKLLLENVKKIWTSEVMPQWDDRNNLINYKRIPRLNLNL